MWTDRHRGTSGVLGRLIFRWDVFVLTGFDWRRRRMAKAKTAKTAKAAKTATTGPKRRQGFAVMDAATQRAIASKGGKAAHEQKTAHEWTSETARAAGRKGGTASRGGRGKIIDEGEP